MDDLMNEVVAKLQGKAYIHDIVVEGLQWGKIAVFGQGNTPTLIPVQIIKFLILYILWGLNRISSQNYKKCRTKQNEHLNL